MENARPGKWQNGNAKPGKWQKIHALEKAKTTHLENAQPGNWQIGKCTTWKMAENTHLGKRQKINTWKMAEWKMLDLENGRKYTPLNKTENTHLVNAQPGICTTWKMTE